MTYQRIALILISALWISCNINPTETPSFENEEKVEVSISLSSTSTRTELDPDDNTTVRWSNGDVVAIWAKGVTTNSWEFTSEPFTLRYYGAEYYQAEFSSSISAMTSDDSYTYTALYPYPESIASTVVGYTIPTEQSGEYIGELDIRVADSVIGAALDSGNSGDVSLSFRSLMHILKISIPAGHNALGADVAKLIVTMPEGVNIAGTQSYDISDTNTAPSIVSNGSNSITLTPQSTITAGDGQSLYLFINPVSGVTGDLSIQGIGSGGQIAKAYEIELNNHTFTAGYITPVYTAIGEEMPATTITITITENNIGEELTSVNLTAPSGAIFSESGSNEIEIANDGTGVYKASYLAELYGTQFNSGSIAVEYESPQTLVPADEISAGSYTIDGTTNFNRTVPYVLYETFGSVSSLSSNDNTTVGSATSNSGSKSSVSITGATGWEGARVAASAGTAVRICCRYESGASFITGVYDARIDSPALTYLKDGATAKVSYNFKGGRNSAYKTSFTSSWTYGGNGTAIYSYGTTTNTGGFDSNDALDAYYGTDIEVPNTSGSDYSTSQNYNDIDEEGDFTIYEAGPTTRVGWTVSTTFDYEYFWGTNGNFWLYLDNVCVQVVSATTVAE